MMRPVFVGGCPRSGTTLLGALLGATDASVAVPEAVFKWALFPHLTADSDELSLPEARRTLLNHWQFPLWEVAIEQIVGPSISAITYRKLLDNLAAAHREVVGRPEASVWVDHTPGNIRYVPTLHHHFPEAKFVNVIRDGRAVANSALGLDWTPRPVWAIAEWWAQHLAVGLASEHGHPGSDHVMSIRYEDLVADPEAVLGEVCEFIDLDFSPSMARGGGFVVPPHVKSQRLFERPPDPTRAEAWRSSLPSRQVELFEYSSYELLTMLGYETVYGARARGPSRGERVLANIEGGGERLRGRLRTIQRNRRRREMMTEVERNVTDGAD